MTRLPPLPRCLSRWQDVRCQLEAGHRGDHLHTVTHTNAIHTIAWIDNINELAHTIAWIDNINELAHSRRRRRQART